MDKQNIKPALEGVVVGDVELHSTLIGVDRLSSLMVWLLKQPSIKRYLNKFQADKEVRSVGYTG